MKNVYFFRHTTFDNVYIFQRDLSRIHTLGIGSRFVKQGEMQRMLVATNRWWRNPRGWPMDDPDLREAGEAPFRYSADVLDDLAPGGLYVLRGPRRVGKSVEIKRTIETLIGGGVEPRRVLHASVDGWRAGDLGGLVTAARQLTPNGGRRFWFIDEITGITDGWPERIKWLRDNDARFRTDTVVLTGSSAADLTGSVKALAGRRGPADHPDRVLLPMGFRSFARLTVEEPVPADIGPLRVADLTPGRVSEAAHALVPWLDLLAEAWETYLLVGGFPAAVSDHMTSREGRPPARSPGDSAMRNRGHRGRAGNGFVPYEASPPFVRGLIDVIHGDAFRRADWSRVQTTAFMHRMARGLCSPVNYAALADDLGISQPTARRRIDELREAFVLWPCHREDGLRPKLNAQAKTYFTDPVYARLVPGTPDAGGDRWRGIAGALDTSTPGMDTPDPSALSEQQLGMALLRSFERDHPGSYMEFDRVLHHRTRTRKEIDFVGPAFGGIAIESKYVDGRWRRDVQTLAASGWRGIVATRSELNLENANVMAIPASMLAWMIDG